MRRVILIIAAIFLSLPAMAQEPQEKRVPGIDDYLMLKDISGVAISPDGASVAFTVGSVDLEADKYVTQLWLARPGDEALQLTYGEKSVGNISWTADGGSVAFLRDGKINLLPVTGGEARLIDLGEVTPVGYDFSPDGGTLAFVTAEPENDGKEVREKRFAAYKVHRGDGNFRHIWTVALGEDGMTAGEPQQRTRGRDYSVAGFNWAPDSAGIIFTTWPRPDLAALTHSSRYILALEDGTVRQLAVSEGSEGTAIFSPDGTRIAYTNNQAVVALSNIIIADADGANPGSFTDDFDGGTRLIDWNAAGIWFWAYERTASQLFRLDPTSGEIARVTGPDGLMGRGFSLSDDGGAYAYMAAGAGEMGDVYLVRGGEAPERLTDFGAQLDPFHVSSREIITWNAADGTEIEGILHKPYDFDPARKYPLYVITHGGPSATDQAANWFVNRRYPMDHWSGRGALILQTNYRGSTGYGEAFHALNYRNLGVGPADDIIAGINHLDEMGIVDNDRIVCLGWSQGGIISAMLGTYSDRCTTAIMGAGISNWATYYYNTDVTFFTQIYLGADPLSDPEVYRKTSPVTYVPRASTPILILHGERDQRVPTPNGYELYQALTDHGIDTEFVIYSGMGHGPSAPKQRRAINHHMDAWINHQLFGAERPDFVEPAFGALASESDDTEEDVGESP